MPRSANANGKILTLGELLVEFIPTEKTGRIDKAGTVLKTASGSAGICACAAARLGADSGFLGKVGKDALSRMVYDTITGEGVDCSRVIVADDGQIGLAFIEYLEGGSRNYQYYRNRSAGSLYSRDDLDPAYLAGAYALHFPGMLLELTEEMRSASMAAAEIAKENGVLLSFDPNIRFELSNSRAAEERMRKVLAMADVIAPTLAEGRIITGKESVGDVLRALHAMGPRVVALTRDKDGAVLSIGGEVALCGGIDVLVVDPTGAGDTFDAALLTALQRNLSLTDAALFCNCAGTLVVQKRGTIGLALPTRAEVEAFAATQPCTVETVRLSDLA